MVASSLFSRTMLACVFLLGNTALAKTTQGRISVERDDQTIDGCLNSQAQWVRDTTKCATFEAKDHNEHTIFSLSTNGNFCRVRSDFQIVCDLKNDDDATWQANGDIRNAGAHLLSENWIPGEADDWFSAVEPGSDQAVAVTGAPTTGSSAAHFSLAWFPK